MSGAMKIAPLGPAPAPAANAAKIDPKLAHVAREFETIFVKELLKTTKLEKEGAMGGYGSMAVDALASGIEGSGGIGLARALEDALARGVQSTAQRVGKEAPTDGRTNKVLTVPSSDRARGRSI